MGSMRNIFEIFVTKSGEYFIIDEILESFRGRCKFRVYTSNKSAKYAIKTHALVDAKYFIPAIWRCMLGVEKQPTSKLIIQQTI